MLHDIHRLERRINHAVGHDWHRDHFKKSGLHRPFESHCDKFSVRLVLDMRLDQLDNGSDVRIEGGKIYVLIDPQLICAEGKVLDGGLVDSIE